MAAKQSIIALSDGAKVLVRLLGDHQNKNKPLFIALHGAPGMADHSEPETSFSFLVNHFRVLVYDARGSGESDVQPPFTHERWIADLDEIRQWAGEEKFILAGGSYGGLIALGYTLANPGRVLALILRSTCAYGYRAVLRGISIISGFRDHINLAQQLRLASGSTLNSHDFEMAMADLVPIGTVENKLAANPSSHDDESEPKKKNYHHETHNAAFSFNMPRFDVRARLREIKTPTFIVVGRLDPVTPVEDAQELHDGIRNSQLAIFENSAHSPPLEEPDAFRERVWGFLSQTLQMMVHSSEPRRGHWSKSML